MAVGAALASVRSSLRYLLADFIGEDGGEPPFLPDGLPESAVPAVSEGIHLLTDYQGASYAQLYVDRVKRFVGRTGVDEVMLGEIARLLAMRMSPPPASPGQSPRVARWQSAHVSTCPASSCAVATSSSLSA